MPHAPQPQRGAEPRPFARALPAIALLTAMFFLNVVSRIILAPLLPVIEADMGMGHAEAGRLFLYMTLGNAAGVFGNGLVSAPLGHRGAVVVSGLVLGAGLGGAGLCADPLAFKAMLLTIGVGAGLYLPSGLSTLMGVIRPEDSGKAVAVHEAAPNIGFVAAPLIAELALALAGWRQALMLMGAVLAVASLLFARFGPINPDPGKRPDLALAGRIYGVPMFWVLLVCFCLAVGAVAGPYSMLPLYLGDLGFERPFANQLLAAARVGALVTSLLAGWLTDRLGTVRTLRLYFLACGSATLCLGLARGPWLVGAVFAQALCSSMFFPAAFTVLSRLFPGPLRSAAVSFMVPFTVFLGMGGASAALGFLGEAGLFHMGFMAQGALLLACLGLTPLLAGGDRATDGAGLLDDSRSDT